MISESYLQAQPGKYSLSDNRQCHNLKGSIKYLKQNCFFAVDSSGFVIKGQRIYDCFDNNNMVINYDSNGQLISETHYYGDGSINFKRILKRINKNRIEELRENDAFKDTSNFQYSSIIISDDKGKVIVNYNHKLDGSFDFKDTLVYDENDKIAYKETYCNGRFLFRENYKYAENNKSIEETDSDRKSRTLYLLDDNGNIIKRNVFWDSKLVQEIKCKYNTDGNVIEVEQKESEEPDEPIEQYFSIRTYKYEFDSIGNWTKCIVYENGKLSCFTIRDIKYY
jgi:hypothetical protein